jgi:biopolymer transport protein ExbD
MIELERRKPKIKPISLVPLINVVFLLVIYFMIAGHLEKFSIIDVTLPVADSGQLLDDGPIQVVLGRYNEILINDELYDTSQVMAILGQHLSVNPERIITIKADANLEANALVGFMEQVRAAGGRNLSLVTESGAMHVGG